MPKKIADPVQYPLTGIWSDTLKTAYDTLRTQYKTEGRNVVYLNSLRKARLALTRLAPPHQINEWTWLVGSTSNHTAEERGEQAMGHRCIPKRGRCDCQDGRLVYDTCVHQEIVSLYLYCNELQRPIQSAGLSGDDRRPATAVASALYPQP